MVRFEEKVVSRMIRMTKTADYAIVLLTRMASESERIFAAPELAHDAQLPAPTVSKVLKILAREGLLASHRGAKGGYSLQLDDTPGECGQEPVCPVRGNWQRINEAIRQALDSITLAEMAPPATAELVTIGDRATRAVADVN